MFYMFLSLFFSITDEQHPNHSFIKLSNPTDYIVSNILHTVVICINDIRSIVGVLALITKQSATVSFLASLSGNMLMKHAVCDSTIIGVRYKVSSSILISFLSDIFQCLHPDCLDFDLCERCEAHPIPLHPENHPLLKMRTENTMVPLQRNCAPSRTEPSFAFNAAAEITRDISPNDASTVHTPTVKAEVLQPSPIQAPDVQLNE